MSSHEFEMSILEADQDTELLDDVLIVEEAYRLRSTNAYSKLVGMFRSVLASI